MNYFMISTTEEQHNVGVKTEEVQPMIHGQPNVIVYAFKGGLLTAIGSVKCEETDPVKLPSYILESRFQPSYNFLLFFFKLS